ncbi:HlyD family efflux transporter periplasmic adaptor subunit [Tolypothrix sp. FACHB-123]|uniref:HlyD family secretion protein n=1 Tax=Tolypothrix sp. FACHB-123 TaxID=2692868 RepID=UPI001687A0E7|nr:HlyD family efflux transporter periplasmic adaptor subunit [Tolypothrix sp. FACHB-123]MBD2357070.1 HlyD family efflux transporter periplasmic adaptor subunit [Tolypothrix sp. FACHB-123]
MTDLLKDKEFLIPADTVEKNSGKSNSLLLAAMFVALGATATVVGATSIGYRLTNIVVENVAINGRIVRLTSPINGTIQAFYAKPGVAVKSGQVLGRVNTQATFQEQNQTQQLNLQLQKAQDERVRWQLEHSHLAGEVQSYATQLVGARQSLNLFKNQLQNLENQYLAVQGVDINLSRETVNQQQAAVDAAIAKATSAKADYQRYQQLLAAGAVSKQQVDKLRFTWESAAAEVKQTQANLRSAQAVLNASQKGVAFSKQDRFADSFAERRAKLLQAIQEQQIHVNTLESKLASGKQQLNHSLKVSQNKPNQAIFTKEIGNIPQFQAITAPFTGVIYSTEREQGEQVNQGQPVLTLLDCNDLWLETVIRSDDASRIDTQKPVKVKFAGETQILSGEVDIIQPISSIQGIEERSKLTQVQALLPTIPANLVGKPLARVTVKMPPPPAHTQSQRFCGLGHTATLTFSKK